MTNFLFVADFFADEVPGGGELNNEVLIRELSKRFVVKKIKSNELQNLEQYKKHKIIVANFINLSESVKKDLSCRGNYAIYEHDHKYLKTRNPATYRNYIAPKDQIINEDFYLNANAVLCQSEFHKQIMLKNLNINNVINLSGNLWDELSRDYLIFGAQNQKKSRAAIMLTNNWHKNTKGAVEYCKKNQIEFELLLPNVHEKFLQQMSKNKSFVFLPKTPETLSRVAVEARMMNLSLVTNDNLGATSEEWFNLKGEELIDYVFKEMKHQIVKKIEKIFHE